MCQQLDVPNAIDAEWVPKVSGDCPLDPEVDVGEDGYPAIFGDIIMSEVAVDEDGYPTIFGDIITAEGKEAMQDDDSLPSMAEGKEAMQDDDSLPSIKPINPNVRARKLEVNAAAKALIEDDVANGVERKDEKRLKRKQPIKKTKNLKATVIQ